MTPAEMNIVKSLVAVAWADGKMEDSETSVVEGLLCGFDATPAEEQEVLDYAKTRRTLQSDVPLQALSREDRELLFANAALLTMADGVQSDSEKAVLVELASILEFSATEAKELLESARDGAIALGSRPLEEVSD